MKLYIKTLDILIVFIVTCVTFFSIYAAYMKPQNKPQVLIRGQGGEWVFAQDARETVIVKGTLGDTIVRIENNRAWVEESPCANQTCVASGMITRHGQWAACLPNNVLLMIQGGGSDDVDIVAW